MSKKRWSVVIAVSVAVVAVLVAIFSFNKPAKDALSRFAVTFFNEAPDITFKDVASQAGIHFRHFYGTRTSQIPEDMGSGAAWIDYDQDGWQDLFVVNEVGPWGMSGEQMEKSPARCALYHNNGDGTFTDVTLKAGITFKGWGMGVDIGDYNNDGWPDIFIAADGHNVLYRNNGDGTFTDVTKKAGLYNYKGFWTDGRWGDYDRDGNLDLYVTGYLKYKKLGPGKVSQRYNVMVPENLNPLPFPAEPNLLFHNNGDGTFTEVSQKAGVTDIEGKSLSAVWCDFNDDGWPDLFVANDGTYNKLYMNKRDGTFLDVSDGTNVSDNRSSMGIGVGDWDQDGDMDLYLTNWEVEENGLYMNFFNPLMKMHSFQFRDVADRFGAGKVSEGLVSWGTSFIDFDNDTRLDLFFTNGSTDNMKNDPTRLVPMPSKLLWNIGIRKGFRDVSKYCGKVLSRKIVARGTAFGDYDNDGDVDVFIVNHEGQALLLRNDGGNRNNWLEASLTGTGKSNRSAIGGKVHLFVDGNMYIREVGVQSSYLSANSLVQHFGLGSYDHVDSLAVIWPDGTRQTFDRPPINKILKITEGNPNFSVFK
ncbi:MAG TPA: CRTAC1 family protein [Balneolales bacterium]|nr:CRTAC1 family protein [Balneolales bacterium]